MKMKEVWTDKDFEIMNWHDNHIHSISFSNDGLDLILDIDYLFEWILDENTGLYNFLIAPCFIRFYNALQLKINLNYEHFIGLNIDNINRINPKLSPNKHSTVWSYIIETDRGIISFESASFIQKILHEPILSQSQVIKRTEIYS